MPTIDSLLPFFTDHPHFARTLDVRSFMLFAQLVSHFRPYLSWVKAPHHSGPPPLLPDNYQLFFSSVLGIPQGSFPEVWTALRDQVWTLSPSDESQGGMLSKDLVCAVSRYGLPNGIGEFMSLCPYLAPTSVCLLRTGVHALYPPTRTCLRPNCKYTRADLVGLQQVLGHHVSTPVVYFSREYGPVPAVSHSMTCSRKSSLSELELIPLP